MTHKFEIGDVIISKQGKYPLKVVTLPPNSHPNCSWTLQYLHKNETKWVENWCIEQNYSLYESSETTMTNSLYSFTKADGMTAFGTHIGTNSQNKFLIEEKVTGEIHIIDKEHLEEVLPYTFSAKIGSNESHYIGTPDVLKVGDILLHTGSTNPQVAVVTAVDTKNKGAKKFKGSKIVTVEI